MADDAEDGLETLPAACALSHNLLMKKFFSDYAFEFKILGAIAMAAGFFALVNWESSISQKKADAALARCEEWKSKGGFFLWKLGPLNNSFEPWGPDRRDFMVPVRRCRRNTSERLVFGDEYTQEFINSTCHSGYRYMPNLDYRRDILDVYADMDAATCFQGDSSQSRGIKVWSWRNN